MSPSSPHILIIDDDNRLRNLLDQFLRSEGYITSQAANAKEARKLLQLFCFDLLILDVMMPGESGIELAESIRDANAPPVLMLSALAEPDQRIAGLQAGVDDYVSKPFEPDELMLRIRAILRRMRPASATERIVFGHFEFDTKYARLTKHDEVVHLTNAEQEMLRILATNLGSAVSREALAEGEIGDNENTRRVDVIINRLRKKIEPSEKHPIYIQTVRGEGYILLGEKDAT